MLAPDPDAGMFAPSFAGAAEASAGLDHGTFERAHEGNDLAKTLEFADGIDDELTWPVVGNVPAALHLDDVDPARR